MSLDPYQTGPAFVELRAGQTRRLRTSCSAQKQPGVESTHQRCPPGFSVRAVSGLQAFDEIRVCFQSALLLTSIEPVEGLLGINVLADQASRLLGVILDYVETVGPRPVAKRTRFHRWFGPSSQTLQISTRFPGIHPARVLPTFVSVTSQSPTGVDGNLSTRP